MPALNSYEVTDKTVPIFSKSPREERLIWISQFCFCLFETPYVIFWKLWASYEGTVAERQLKEEEIEEDEISKHAHGVRGADLILTRAVLVPNNSHNVST